VKLHQNLYQFILVGFRKVWSLFFYNSLSRKKIFGHTRPQIFGQENPKNYLFKANLRLVKNSYCPKIKLTHNIWTSIYKKISKIWPLLLFVSLKYCVEKRLLKTHVVFFYESDCKKNSGGANITDGSVNCPLLIAVAFETFQDQTFSLCVTRHYQTRKYVNLPSKWMTEETHTQITTSFTK
jgi:hypothetical protein